MKKTVIPAIIAKNQRELDERIRKIESDVYQLDIMDGKFVRNKSIMFNFQIPPKIKYEAHLMIHEPKRWINRNYEKINTIIFHLESCKNPREVVKLIKGKGKKAGVAINPKTSVKEVLPLLEEVDMVLIMTVIPGRYGSKFIPRMLNKVRELRKLKPELDIEVDGGIDDKTIPKTLNAGANRFVVGSFLQNSENPKKAFSELKKKVK